MLPALAGLELAGASAGELDGFDSEKDVAIHVSGSSVLKGSLGTAKAVIGLSGASTLALTGKAQRAELSAQGSSQLKLPEFLVRQCEVTLAGASTGDISVKSTAPFVAKVSGSSTLKGSVESSDIDLELRGASRAILRGSSKNAKIVVEGSSQLKSSDFAIDAQSINLEVLGASKAAIHGTVGSAVVKGTGSSHLDLEDLKSKSVEITLSGASHAKVAASGSLTYHLSSASQLNYSGDPTKLDGETTGVRAPFA